MTLELKSRINVSISTLFYFILIVGCGTYDTQVQEEEMESIWQAILNSDVEAVVQFAESNGNMDLQNNSNESLLRFALKHDRFDCFEQLLKSGANPNFVCSDGHVVTHLACEKIEVKWVASSLMYGANPNQINSHVNKCTPFFFAIYNRQCLPAVREQIVKALLDSGGDPNKSCRGLDRFPLEVAVSHNEFRIAVMLLKNGADIFAAPAKDGSSFLEKMSYKDVKLLKPLGRAGDEVIEVHRYLNQLQIDPKEYSWNGEQWVKSERQ